MDSKLEKEAIKNNLLKLNLLNEPLEKFFFQLDDLEKNQSRGYVDSRQVEDFILHLSRLIPQIPQEQKELISTEMALLTSKYTSLFSLLKQTFIKMENDEHSDRLISEELKEMLLEPMLFQLAETTETFYVSKYFGKIPIVTTNSEHPIHLFKELDLLLQQWKINQSIEKEEIKLAFKPYVLIFGLLNQYDAVSQDSLIKHLEDTALPNQNPSKKISPKFMLVTKEVMDLYTKNKLGTFPNVKMFLKKQAFIVSINSESTSHELLAKIIYGLQHIYNSLYMQNQAKTLVAQLPLQEFNHFIEFANSLDLNKAIMNNILEILKFNRFYEKQFIDIHELSAQFTVLFFQFLPSSIRQCINILLEKSAQLSKQNELQIFCKAMNNAFALLESTLQHLSLSLALSNYENLAKISSLIKKRDLDSDFNHKLIRLKTCPLPWYVLLGCSVKNNTRGIHFLLGSAHDPDFILNAMSKIGTGQQALWKQAKSGKIDEHLLSGIIDIDRKDAFGYSALAYTVMFNGANACTLLLQYGASLNFKKDQENLLHLAARNGSFDVIPILIHYNLPLSACNKKQETPLFIMSQYIAHFKIEESYTAVIKALTYFLSHSNEEVLAKKDTLDISFYESLLHFRKAIAFLYLLYESQALIKKGVRIPLETLPSIATKLGIIELDGIYEWCYKDILIELYNNEAWFASFKALGQNALLQELQIERSNKLNFFQQVIEGTILPKQLIHYFTPRSLSEGAISLAAVTLAQQQIKLEPKKFYFFTENKFKDRQLLITQWKKKIANQEGNELSAAILQVCKELGIKELENEIYHQLSELLYKLVITEKKVPNRTDFVSELKELYEHTITDNKMMFS